MYVYNYIEADLAFMEADVFAVQQHRADKLVTVEIAIMFEWAS